jgi:hypothetical protein
MRIAERIAAPQLCVRCMVSSLAIAGWFRRLVCQNKKSSYPWNSGYIEKIIGELA